MSGQGRRLVLDSLHRERSANWRPDGGLANGDLAVPSDYGDPEAEVSEARHGCALWDASSADGLELVGEDRNRFLNGLVTTDVATLEPGQTSYGLLTTAKGRIMADATIMVHVDSIWLRLPAGLGRVVREHMERFIITDRVQLRPLERFAVVIIGEHAAECLTTWGGGDLELPQSGEHRVGVLLGTEVRLVAESRRGAPAFSVWSSAESLNGLARALLDSEPAPRLIGLEAIEALRVGAGVPRFGFEFDDHLFPQEAGLEEAVSYEKGCYLGQEVVARIHYRGGVHRGLRGFRISGRSAGDTLVAGGREVGRLTSRARDASGDPVALGIVAEEFGEVGCVLEIAGGGSATVVDLPFA